MRPLVELRSKKKVILCIDDDPSVLECEREFLATFGYGFDGPERRRRIETSLRELR